MGRKSNSKQSIKKNAGPTKENNKFLIQTRKELAVLVDKLLQLTSIFHTSSNLSKCWEHYLEVKTIINQITEIESSIKNTKDKQNRQNNIEEFTNWLKENGALFEGIEISEFEGYDLGLKAMKDFGEGSLILTVPRKVMLTNKEAADSELGTFITVDPLLQNMPNITLAFFLLLEKANPDSFWKPYINILPEKYSTVLYFTSDELSELKPSPVMEQSLKLYRSIARQYAYFYNKIFSLNTPVLKKLREVFSYENYRWAVSTVMTRQNNIHLANLDTTAFIPLWDMCNHEHGKITTDFNSEKNQGECFALRNFEQGEQIFIYYGARPNSDLFLHNGFVYPDNKQDSLSLALGVSAGDALRDVKLELLNKLGLSNVTHFNIYNSDPPISPELLAFVRIFNMNKEELSEWSSRGVPGELVAAAGQGAGAGAGGERRALAYLQTRCALLRALYARAPAPAHGDLTAHGNNIKLLKECEVRILENAISFLKSILEKLPTDEKTQ